MIPDDNLRKICQELLDRSKRNEVNWQKSPGSNYYVALPAASMHLRYLSPEYTDDYLEFSVKNSDQVTVGTMRGPKGSEDWNLLAQLWVEASRAVTRWDVTLESVEKALKSDTPIGGAPENQDLF